MKWIIDEPDRVKVQWRLIWLNIAAAVMNFTIAIVTWRAISIANIISGAFSAWVAWTFWKKIPKIKQEQAEKIIDYLRG